MTDQRSSIQDVARAAGVSTSTVSNALNRPATVAAGTLDRISKAIEDLSYVRNEHAASLRLGKPGGRRRDHNRLPSTGPGEATRPRHSPSALPPEHQVEIEAWCQDIDEGGKVDVYLHGRVFGSGTTDGSLTDGSAFWIQFDDGRGRRLILREDGFTLVKPESPNGGSQARGPEAKVPPT
ncbi:LacI family DNA-binding transcriptional regulator [Arthrobacter sp. SA17]